MRPKLKHLVTADHDSVLVQCHFYYLTWPKLVSVSITGIHQYERIITYRYIWVYSGNYSSVKDCYIVKLRYLNSPTIDDQKNSNTLYILYDTLILSSSKLTVKRAPKATRISFPYRWKQKTTVLNSHRWSRGLTRWNLTFKDCYLPFQNEMEKR